MIKEILKPEREFEFWESDAEFYRTGAVAARSNCIMDSGKLAKAGIKMPSAQNALQAALMNWLSEG
jgi:hypothetical protein